MAYSDPKIFDDVMREHGQVPVVVSYVSHSRLKRGLDLLVSLAFLALVLPLFAVIALGLRKSGDGTIFDRRPVIGRKGAEFNALLFRSDANTRLGRWLRGTGLGSLPQLLNVLFGHMSLVGPKPLQIGEFDGLKNSVSLYMTVRPGLTGLWFVSDERSMGAVARTRLDRIYIKTGSLLMDLGILLRTPFVFLRLA